MGDDTKEKKKEERLPHRQGKISATSDHSFT